MEQESEKAKVDQIVKDIAQLPTGEINLDDPYIKDLFEKTKKRQREVQEQIRRNRRYPYCS